jgi:outer membrane receptor protein involved in Fe transport
VNAFSAKYHLQENYPAAYVNFKMYPDEKTNLIVGFRYEYTHSKLGSDTTDNIVDHHYGNLFPVFVFSRKLNESGSFDLSYNRRITRPTFNDMAPFVIFIDPYTYFSGNPALQPAIIDNFGLQYQYKKNVINISYSNEKSSMADFFPTIDSVSHLETLSAVNMDYTKTWSGVITIPVQVCNWWNMSNSVTATWQSMKTLYNKAAVQINQGSFRIQTTQEFVLPKDFLIEVSAYYQSTSLLWFYKLSPSGSLDLSLQKKMGKKGTVTLNVTNILNSTSVTASVNQPSQNLVTSLFLHGDYPSFKVTYSVNFGSDKVKEKRNRLTGSEDEQSRLHN